MATPDMMVPARYYARMAELLVGDGIDLIEMLKSMRVPVRALDQPDAMLRFAQVDRLLCDLAPRLSRTDLAFDLGQRLTASAHSLVGFGMLNSETLDQALRFEARYFSLVMPSFRMRYSAGADFAELHLTPTVAMSHICLAFHLEAIGTAALRELSDLTGGRRPSCWLQHSMPEPPHSARYRELQDVRVSFSADVVPGVRLRVAGDMRAFPLAMADPNARKVAEARCQALVRTTTRVKRFADWVTMTLREMQDELPSMIDLAIMLNVAPRTLNRYLAREGTSFRQLCGQIQHELACQRLESGTMSVTEVACSLGFSDTSNFARAFRARAGRSPSDFQRDAVAGSGITRVG